MRSWKCLAAVVISCLAACNQTVGQCWIDNEGNVGSPGAGGGPIVSGSGGSYGDIPPEPQGASKEPLYFDCDVSDSPCAQKCLTDFEAAASECANIADEDQREVCQHAAYVRYMTCRQTCKQMDDWRKKCDDEADACEAECRKLPKDDKAGRSKCWQDCNNAYGECKKKCKG